MRLEKHYGTALLSRGIGEYQEIADWGAYIQKLPTLEQELEKLPLPRRRAKAVYLIHHPPWHLGLATTLRPEGLADVGSKAVYDFIATRQPWLTFHGHIHDSPLRTDTWQAKLDDTLCIQPGQSLTKDNERDKLIYVLIDLKTRAAKRFEEARLI
jgi:Icc-related predicted phosphoesterase